MLTTPATACSVVTWLDETDRTRRRLHHGGRPRLRRRLQRRGAPDAGRGRPGRRDVDVDSVRGLAERSDHDARRPEVRSPSTSSGGGLRRTGTTSSFCRSLTGREVFGELHVHFPEGVRLVPDDVDYLRALADHAALSTQNAALFARAGGESAGTGGATTARARAARLREPGPVLHDDARPHRGATPGTARPGGGPRPHRGGAATGADQGCARGDARAHLRAAARRACRGGARRRARQAGRGDRGARADRDRRGRPGVPAAAVDRRRGAPVPDRARGAATTRSKHARPRRIDVADLHRRGRRAPWSCASPTTASGSTRPSSTSGISASARCASGRPSSEGRRRSSPARCRDPRHRGRPVDTGRSAA